MALNASTFDFMPLIQGYPALKFGRGGMAREKVLYLSGMITYIIYLMNQ